MPKVLRDYQNEAIAGLRKSIATGHRRPVLCAPTGSGKTAMAAAIVQYAQEKGNRAIFTVPAIELVDQTIEAFWNDGIRDVGVIQADHHMTRPDAPVQVASVQTLMRRGVPPGFKLGIIDECHRLFKFWDKWFPEANHPIVGLSATPGTRGLGKYFDDLIVACTTQELIDAGFLSPFRAFAQQAPDLQGLRTVAGDYHEGDLADASNKPELVADIVSTWLDKAERRPTLLFAVDRAHAKALQQQFLASGVKCGYVDCHTPDFERKALKSSFHRGDLEVVCNVGVLTTGVDWDVRCISMCRPTKSVMLWVQMIGRALRTAIGKDYALILDHSDNTQRLGFVTDIFFDHLDDGKPKVNDSEKPIALPKECPECHYLKPPKTAKCPACGFKAEAQSHVEVETEVELKEVTPYKHTREEKQYWYSGLLWIANERSRNTGWAGHRFREKFGVWPRGLDERSARPGDDVYGYVKHSMIKWAKSKAKQKEFA